MDDKAPISSDNLRLYVPGRDENVEIAKRVLEFFKELVMGGIQIDHAIYLTDRYMTLLTPNFKNGDANVRISNNHTKQQSDSVGEISKAVECGGEADISYCGK